ncbi:unnamed protein product, partial [Acanthoscelides obtectus]
KGVLKRWKHLRDAFAKAEKKAKQSKTSGAKATKIKKYIYNDELQFLKKIYDNPETTESFVTKDNKEIDASGHQPPESPQNTQHEIRQSTVEMDVSLKRRSSSMAASTSSTISQQMQSPTSEGSNKEVALPTISLLRTNSQTTSKREVS